MLSSLDKSEAEAWRRITWAFFVLDRTYNASRNYSICLSDNHFTLSFPLTTIGDHSPRGFLHDKSPNHEQNGDLDILACLLRLYSLWGKVTEWVFEPLETSTLPPWHSGSSLAVLESEWMEFETRFANVHRYRNVDFKRRAREDPDSRQYLSTWLCVQFLFHSIQCLLHHPFVTMVKLRHMKGNLSAAFLQKSFESSLLHSRWIARFIREMTEVELRICDPFVGYLAAIAATIQLEHTGNKNPKIALLLNSEYRVLVGFITNLSLQWGSMKVLVRRVNELASRHQNYGSLFYNQDGFSGELSSMATPSNLPRMSAQDEALMWDILDLTSCGSGPQSITKPPATTSIAAEIPNLDTPAPGEAVLGEVEPAIIDGATGEWPFEHRGLGLGTGVPDIPDWMIFGDFMSEHL
ncbi:Transcription factor [Penicillium verhagenii]|uniref:Transcription factor n=1 Tax=Penicillium verhagenii TaxID=1562060 RepID=UPI00254594DA|nr:Transcription factor [Penicillium verhagenii]KAJ5919418.1 Transcription factor [Penicillium verhagenii]